MMGFRPPTEDRREGPRPSDERRHLPDEPRIDPRLGRVKKP